MKTEWVAAERVEEIRAAANGWKTAGAIEAPTFDEILRRYPEPRVLPSTLWRVLVFGFVSLALLLLLGAFTLGGHPNIGGVGALLGCFGIACVVATEVQENSPAFAFRGSAGATAFWGVVFLLGALFILFEEVLHLHEPDGPNAILLAAFALCALAAWRWGSPAWALLAAVALFLLLARAPEGRLLWIACGVGFTALFERVLDRPSWAPSHRRCAAVLVVAGLAAVYGAMNLYAFDHRLVAFLRETASALPGPRPGERVFATLGTAILPIAVVWWGVRSRRTFVLGTGLVLAALSFVTLRAYVHLAPLWLILTAAGGALVLLSLALNRWLDEGLGKERSGFTAAPLFSDEGRLRALELLPVLAAHSPQARTPDAPGFEGGGGSFGGGGAGGSY
jgi:MFS family permease